MFFTCINFYKNEYVSVYIPNIFNNIKLAIFGHPLPLKARKY